MTLFQVVLQRHVAVEQHARLCDFTICEVGDHLGDELDDLEVVEISQIPEG